MKPGIHQFYQNRSVFVTGATGFVGKVLVEKLLRSFPNIKNVYVLIRPKRKADVFERIQDLKKSPIFNRLKQSNPASLEKLQPIAGDITMPCLGISKDDQNTLLKNASVVFHSAATIRFTEPLSVALNTNLGSTMEIAKLCHKMENLQSFVYVSTAACHGRMRKVIEENVDCSVDALQEFQRIREMDEENISKKTRKVLETTHPNTYTYSKFLAENYIARHCKSLPAVIVRPSAVIGSIKEPVPGWIDNLGTTTGLLAAGGERLLSLWYVGNDREFDIIPVDKVTNMLISAGWGIGTNRINRLDVFNCTSSSINPLMASQFCTAFKEFAWKTDFLPIIKPKLHLSRNRMYYLFQMHVLQRLIVFMIILSGNNPILFKRYKKAVKQLVELEYFFTHTFDFKVKNTWKLWDEMSEDEKTEFDFDVRTIIWDEHLKLYIRGIQAYVYKEIPNTN